MPARCLQGCYTWAGSPGGEWILTPQEIHFREKATAARTTTAAAAQSEAAAAAPGRGPVPSWEGGLKRKNRCEQQVGEHEGGGAQPCDGGGKCGSVFRGRGRGRAQAQSSIGAEDGAMVTVHLRRKSRGGGTVFTAPDPPRNNPLMLLPGWPHQPGSPPIRSQTPGPGTGWGRCTCACNTDLPQCC